MPHTNRAVAPRVILILGVVLALVIATVFVLESRSAARIQRNEQTWFALRLRALLTTISYDNDPIDDVLLISAPEAFGTKQPALVYRARLAGSPKAVVARATALDGYGGPIELLVAIDVNGSLLGIEILRHRETAGIGDGFLPSRSSWLSALRGRSLANTPPEKWTIRKDDGDFEQFTGASVTPRAILKATRRVLEYYALHRDTLFAPSRAYEPQS